MINLAAWRNFVADLLCALARRMFGVAQRLTPRQNGRVLVVDDEPHVRSTIAEFLAAMRYQTAAVDSADMAVRRIVEAPPDVLILDISMPGLSGVGALPTIRALAPGMAVVVVSGFGHDEIAKWMLDFGACQYVTKPIDMMALRRAVETAMLRPVALV